MRVNVYAEEITDRVEVVEIKAETGSRFVGMRFLLKTHPDMLMPRHPDDDDSAVTFWVKSSRDGYKPGEGSKLAELFEKAAAELRLLDQEKFHWVLSPVYEDDGGQTCIWASKKREMDRFTVEKVDPDKCPVCGPS